MDQKKTGDFLKELRKEQNLTQEQAAEKLGVSSRTISRWETGTYMPDISMLVDIAEMYDVDVREIIDGERKQENMNIEVKETAIKMADYSVMEKKNLLKWIRLMSISIMIVSVCLIILNILRAFAIAQDMPSILPRAIIGNVLISANSIMSYILLAFSTIVTLYASGKFNRFEQSQMPSRVLKGGVVVAVILSVAAVIEAIIETSMIYIL
ncbi:MAG: helix-turn-helix domain-containing protein [Lachnospiraceae bacterium]|nr:helix-turn-helix domain-containing protein [Lachnospiraceae bacterium]MBR6849872.1 helix-turn-helix domain-containing protein [Lachnospiraceae bacterium]